MQSDPESLPPNARPASALPWYWRPYFHVACSIFFSAASQPLLKHGADRTRAMMNEAGAASWQTPFYFLSDIWAWLGIAAQIASLLSWVYALKTVQLNIAFNFTGVTHILVPLASWLLLGEYISPLRWLGITLVCVGVVITAQEAVRLEEKL